MDTDYGYAYLISDIEELQEEIRRIWNTLLKAGIKPVCEETGQ